MFQGSQDDTAFLSDVARRTAPSGFDLIIDDASHIGMLTKVAFWHLFDNHLKSSGLYAIEDWALGIGTTGRTGGRTGPRKLRARRQPPTHGRPGRATPSAWLASLNSSTNRARAT
jgi:hypothetical protein